MFNTKILPGYKTDHSAIVYSFSAKIGKRGKGYWKFNSQLLRDGVYIEKVKSYIRDSESEFYQSGDIDYLFHVEFTCNDQFFFENLKMKIRSLSIVSYSIKRAREEKEVISQLENGIEYELIPKWLYTITVNIKKLDIENVRDKK